MKKICGFLPSVAFGLWKVVATPWFFEGVCHYYRALILWNSFSCPVMLELNADTLTFIVQTFCTSHYRQLMEKQTPNKAYGDDLFLYKLTRRQCWVDFTKSDTAAISQYRKFGKGVTAVLNKVWLSAWQSWVEAFSP